MLLRNASGKPLNATIELHKNGIILHSRSNNRRNRDYRAALEQILLAIDETEIPYEIYLDSMSTSHVPLADRHPLKFDKGAPVPVRFNLIIKAMNEGSVSHGAWRRIFIETLGASTAELERILSRAPKAPESARLPAAELRKVTHEHIQKAVNALRSGGDAPAFGPSLYYDVMTDDGVTLAPKKVFGLALQEALGVEVGPDSFSAGWRHISFQIIEDAGFWIVPKRHDAAPRPKAPSADKGVAKVKLTLSDEERTWIEGNPRIISHLVRERQPGLAKLKRDNFIAFHGKLFCEDCGLDPVAQYGNEAGSACIEVHHHRTHVASMKAGHETAMSDLKCLCANCHRVLHRRLTLGF